MGETIRITTFNARLKCNEEQEEWMWSVRLPRLLTQVKRLDPDLLGFQEVTAEQFEDLCSALSDYDCEYQPRDGEKGEGTPVFYKRDRFELIDKGSYYLNEHPEAPGLGWDAECLRVASFAALKDKKTGKAFTFFNTHLDHRGQTAQVEGIKLMLSKMESVGGSMMLTGDFNVYEGSVTYEEARSLLNDAKMIAKNVSGGGSFHNYGRIDTADISPIDYIFLSGDIEVENYAVYNKKEESGYASDHYAVYADIKIN